MKSRKLWKTIVANLNRAAFDSSPYVITNAEARAAHSALIAAPGSVFAATVAKMATAGGSSSYLNRYIAELKEADGNVNSIKAFAAKLAVLNHKNAYRRLIKNLGPGEWLAFAKAFSQLSSAQQKSFLVHLGQCSPEPMPGSGAGRDAFIGHCRLTAKTLSATLLYKYTSKAWVIDLLSTLDKAFAVLSLDGASAVWGFHGPDGASLFKRFAAAFAKREAQLTMIANHNNPVLQRAYGFVTSP